MKHYLLIITIAVTFFSCSSSKQKADIIIHHATVYTVNSSFSTTEAIAIKDGKILATGTNEEISKYYEATESLDAEGKFIYPGFIDSHCHFLHYGLGLQEVDLVGTTSFNEVVERVKKFSSSPPAPLHQERGESDWIIGRGWDQNDWEVKEYPDKEKLDSLFPNTPVFLTRIDGHAALANTEALRRAGITEKTKVNGGELIFMSSKKNNQVSINSKESISNATLSGVLIDNAVDLVSKVIPKSSSEKTQQGLLAAQANCFSVGLTTVDDAGLMKNEIDIIDQLQKSGKLKMRVYAMLSDSTPNYDYYLKNGPYKTDRLNVRSFKFYGDGALGSRGACMLEDYTDKPGWRGFLLSTPEHYYKHAETLANSGFQMNTHCIGDSAYSYILTTYKRVGAVAYKKLGSTRNRRWRIEHAQVTDPRDINLSQDVILSVQPTHATSDMYWAEKRLGKTRIKYAYAYKELLKASGMLALGTDFPVEDISPFKTFYAAVARKDSKGFPPNGFQIENALTREETLKGMTTWGAYANFEENEKGSIEKGKFADLIILDKDIMKCPIDEVLKTKVLKTYVNGEKVYEK